MKEQIKKTVELNKLKKVLENDKYEVYQLGETPFSIVSFKNEERVRIAIGMKVASLKDFSSITEALKYIKEKPWELVISIAYSIYETFANKNDNNN